MDKNNFKATESASQSNMLTTSAPITVVLDKISDNNKNKSIKIAQNNNFYKKEKSICSDRSIQYSPNLTISDLDSRCNTIDNQSDKDRFNNNAEDDVVLDEDIIEKKKEDLFPGFVDKSLLFFTKNSKLRFWCLRMITSPYPFYI